MIPAPKKLPDGMVRFNCTKHGWVADVIDCPTVRKLPEAWCRCGRKAKKEKR